MHPCEHHKSIAAEVTTMRLSSQGFSLESMQAADALQSCNYMKLLL
jgi:hypothetical protein